MGIPEVTGTGFTTGTLASALAVLEAGSVAPRLPSVGAEIPAEVADGAAIIPAGPDSDIFQTPLPGVPAAGAGVDADGPRFTITLPPLPTVEKLLHEIGTFSQRAVHPRPQILTALGLPAQADTFSGLAAYTREMYHARRPMAMAREGSGEFVVQAAASGAQPASPVADDSLFLPPGLPSLREILLTDRQYMTALRSSSRPARPGLDLIAATPTPEPTLAVLRNLDASFATEVIRGSGPLQRLLAVIQILNQKEPGRAVGRQADSPLLAADVASVLEWAGVGANDLTSFLQTSAYTTAAQVLKFAGETNENVKILATSTTPATVWVTQHSAIFSRAELAVLRAMHNRVEPQRQKGATNGSVSYNVSVLLLRGILLLSHDSAYSAHSVLGRAVEAFLAENLRVPRADLQDFVSRRADALATSLAAMQGAQSVRVRREETGNGGARTDLEAIAVVAASNSADAGADGDGAGQDAQSNLP